MRSKAFGQGGPALLLHIAILDVDMTWGLGGWWLGGWEGVMILLFSCPELSPTVQRSTTKSETTVAAMEWHSTALSSKSIKNIFHPSHPSQAFLVDTFLELNAGS